MLWVMIRVQLQGATNLVYYYPSYWLPCSFCEKWQKNKLYPTIQKEVVKGARVTPTWDLLRLLKNPPGYEGV